MDDSESKTARVLDKTAVALSGLCLVHCLALPFVLAVLPFLSEFTSEHFHAELLLLVIPVSVFAFAMGYRRHHNERVIVFGVLGMVVLAIGGTVAHRYYGLTADRALTIAGGLILSVTHYYNSRLARHRRRDRRPTAA